MTGILTLIVLTLVGLACNAPGFDGSTITPTLTPLVNVTAVGGDAPTETPAPGVTPSPTAFLRVRTPRPERTPAPKPTSTPLPTGAPLTFLDPAWELVEWHEVEGTGEWEGTIRINATGGVPPFQYQIEDRPLSSSPEVTMRWRLCRAMPATVRVWSADGQFASSPIWVWELGCKP